LFFESLLKTNQTANCKNLNLNQNKSKSENKRTMHNASCSMQHAVCGHININITGRYGACPRAISTPLELAIIPGRISMPLLEDFWKSNTPYALLLLLG
jgi:hypothetical protein